MSKFFRVAGIGFAAVIAVVLIFSSLKQYSFLPGFWGLLIFASLYRYLTKAKPLNKYVWLLLATVMVFGNNLQPEKSPLGALVIAGASGLLMISMMAIYDFVAKPLWNKFKPTSQSVQSESSVDLVAPLYLTAAANGDAETLRKLIAENTAVNASDKIGATPLMYAARNNQIECMKILLEAGADRSLQTKKGYTALWFAENNHHEDAASLLRVETIA